MTQQDRPRTSSSNYIKKLENQNNDIGLNKSFSERPSSRRTKHRHQVNNEPIENDTTEKQALIPRPPMMPPREETFLSHTNTSPRKRMYSAARKDSQIVAIDNDSEFSRSDFFTSSHQNFENLKNSLTDFSSTNFTNPDAYKKLQYSNTTKPIIKNFNRQDTVEIISNESTERPISSRISKYTSPLPPISHRLHNVSPENHRQITPSPTNQNEQNFIKNFNNKLKLNNENIEDTEPNENDENSLLIAIRLPNGETIKRYFLKTDSVIKIIKYAAKKSNINFTNENISLLEMPKNSINDFSKTIDDYGLKNRTMLHIIYN